MGLEKKIKKLYSRVEQIRKELYEISEHEKEQLNDYWEEQKFTDKFQEHQQEVNKKVFKIRQAIESADALMWDLDECK